jgi:hypothetical protein
MYHPWLLYQAYDLVLFAYIPVDFSMDKFFLKSELEVEVNSVRYHHECQSQILIDYAHLRPPIFSRSKSILTNIKQQYKIFQ